MKPLTRFLLALAFTLAAPFHAEADTFGSGGNTFIIDFVNVGNEGNADDTGAGGGLYSSAYSSNPVRYRGAVPYKYRMGKYEIPQDAITKATNLGMTHVTAGAWTGKRPAANMTWYEMAAFVNWLNVSTGHQSAYNLTWTGSEWTMSLWSSAQAWQAGGENLFRHKDAYYFLPSDNEWYKAGYHKNDGVTANYWDYATGSNSIPDGIDFDGDTTFNAVFYQGAYQDPPNEVDNVGTPSPYGTYGQNGNVEEWIETAYKQPGEYGTNDSPSEARWNFGGDWTTGEFVLRSSVLAKTTFIDPINSYNDRGFRVASVHKPIVISPPASISMQPQSQRINLNQQVTLTVQLQTPGDYTYQWYKDNVLINNATLPSYSIAAITTNDPGAYKVVISNSVTPVTSDEAILTLNEAPTATAQTVNTDEDVAVGITLSGTDANNDPLTYFIVAGPTHGALSGTAPNLTYTPAPNRNGADSFTFKANDGLLRSPAATITINVAPVSDPFVAHDDIISPGVAANVLANDSDPDGTPQLSIESVTNGSKGIVTISADKATLTYTPGANFFSSDTFSYTSKNGNSSTATVTVRIPLPTAYGIVLKNGAVSGEEAGTVFQLIGQPSITADGRTAFNATYRSPDTKIHPAILFGVTPTVLVHDGSAAAGTTLNFSKFGNPIVSSVGDVAFKASLFAAPKGTADGIWAHDGSAMRLVARQKADAPGIADALFSKFFDIALPDDGRVIFTANLAPGKGGVSAVNDYTLWREDGTGSVALLLREGTTMNVAGAQKTIKTFAVFGPGGVGTLDQQRGFNKNGAILARVSFTDKSSALIRINSDGSKDTILRTPFFYTEIGAIIASFNLPTLADDGSITVQAKLVANAASDTVILSRSAAGVLSVTAREGMAAPNIGGAVYSGFSDSVGGNTNRIAFISKLKPKIGGVTSASDTILWRVNPDGLVAVLARKSLPAPGTNGAAFNLFKSFAWTGSSNDGVAFVATLKPKAGLVSLANDTGLWAEGTDGALYLALRKGATVQIAGSTKTIKSFTVLAPVLGSIGQSHSANFAGGYAVLAVFTDNTKGIVTAWVP